MYELIRISWDSFVLFYFTCMPIANAKHFDRLHFNDMCNVRARTKISFDIKI